MISLEVIYGKGRKQCIILINFFYVICEGCVGDWRVTQQLQFGI